MNSYLESPEKAFGLVTRILKNEPDEYTQEIKATHDLNQFIIEKLIPFANQDSPNNSSLLVDNLQLELERFEDFVAFPALGRLNLIGVGGAFSSGKSSFLNTLLKRRILPVEIDPSTAVPTFLIHQPEENIGAINIFNVKVGLDAEAFKAIGHDFKEKHDIQMGHILKKAFVALPEHPFRNIAFLDTPGYSKPDAQEHTERTDEQIARAQLNTADAIIWVMDIENGTLKENDIDFISSLRRGLSIIVVLMKADKVNAEDIERIMEHLWEIVRDRGLNVEEIMPYSSHPRANFSREPIDKWLARRNQKISLPSFPRNFKRFFSEFRDYYFQERNEGLRRLNRIKSLEMLVESEDEDIEGYMRDIRIEAQNDVRRLKELEEGLLTLRQEFFTILKSIGDLVGIPLPEPSEIDLITENVIPIRSLLEEYNRKRNIKDSGMDEYILHAFEPLDKKNKGPLPWYPHVDPDKTFAILMRESLNKSGVQDTLAEAVKKLNEVDPKPFLNILPGKEHGLSPELTEQLNRPIPKPVAGKTT